MNPTDMLQALPVAVYATDAQGWITFYNEAAAKLWGRRPEPRSVRWCGSWRLYRADGTAMPPEECPMAVTLRDGVPVRGVEAVAERPDGTRVRFLPYPTPLVDAAGKVTGAVNLLIDLSDQDPKDLDLARLAAIVESSDDAIVSKSLDGRISSWNAGATRIFGYEADEMIGQPIMRIIPPELHDQEREILAKLRRGERIEHFDTVRLAKDGRKLDISLTVSPLRDRLGNIVGASKVARDVTERKQAELWQQLLIQELNHRVKNMLATVQALASQSLRHARDPDAFAQAFTGRIQALARIHNRLTAAALQGAEVGAIVRDQVLLADDADERVSIAGPTMMLEPKAATHLALILHELGTNARKYGALSVPGGRLSVEWTLRLEDGRHLMLDWKESGGPKVAAPARRGFGTSLIEQSLSGQEGEARLSFAAHGVTCAIRMPLVEEVRMASAPRPPARPADRGAAAVDRAMRASAIAGRRILLVEDEAFVAMDMAAALADAGCVVVGPVASVDKARAAIAAHDFDAALLDGNLAGHPVDELAALLAKKNVPFAFVTGYGREALPAAHRGAPVLAKPFEPEQLVALAASLLRQGEAIVPLRRKLEEW